MPLLPSERERRVARRGDDGGLRALLRQLEGQLGTQQHVRSDPDAPHVAARVVRLADGRAARVCLDLKPREHLRAWL